MKMTYALRKPCENAPLNCMRIALSLAEQDLPKNEGIGALPSSKAAGYAHEASSTRGAYPIFGSPLIYT